MVFSDETLDNLMDYDAESYTAITREFSYWDEIDFHFHREVVRSTGHGFCGTERRTLLMVLQDALPRYSASSSSSRPRSAISTNSPMST